MHEAGASRPHKLCLRALQRRTEKVSELVWLAEIVFEAFCRNVDRKGHMPLVEGVRGGQIPLVPVQQEDLAVRHHDVVRFDVEIVLGDAAAVRDDWR